jgi:hypothetical protein
MIIVKLSGGLGNQLFQYSFGKYLEHKFKSRLYFDIRINNTNFNETKRYYCLSFLPIEEYNNNLPVFFLNSNNLFSIKIIKLLSSFLPFFFKNIYFENYTNKLFKKVSFNDNCYFDGTWQSYKYCLPFKEYIYDNLTKHIILNNYISTFLYKIQNTNSIAIHIRRGDYLTSKNHNKIMNALDIDYYFKAINYFSLKFSNLSYFVFTEDMQWAKNNFTSDNFIFINPNNPIEDLFLMSHCKHLIIANSTFSWWAAFLNKNNDKIIISPKNWFAPKYNHQISNLIPDKWIKI